MLGTYNTYSPGKVLSALLHYSVQLLDHRVVFAMRPHFALLSELKHIAEHHRPLGDAVVLARRPHPALWSRPRVIDQLAAAQEKKKLLQ